MPRLVGCWDRGGQPGVFVCAVHLLSLPRLASPHSALTCMNSWQIAPQCPNVCPFPLRAPCLHTHAPCKGIQEGAARCDFSVVPWPAPHCPAPPRPPPASPRPAPPCAALAWPAMSNYAFTFPPHSFTDSQCAPHAGGAPGHLPRPACHCSTVSNSSPAGWGGGRAPAGSPTHVPGGTQMSQVGCLPLLPL